MPTKPSQITEKSSSEAAAPSNLTQDDENDLLTENAINVLSSADGFEAKIHIEPGLTHVELGWPHEASSDADDINIPEGVAASGSLERLVDTARGYAEQATAENTSKAYKKDWASFSSWCRRRGAEHLIPDPQLIGLYITEMAAPQDGSPALSVSTIERRLSGLSWNYQQRGQRLDRKDRHIATVLAGIRRKHGKPPVQKEPISPEELLEMVSRLSFGLRDMRDRAILLLGYAAGLRRSEIVGLDVNRDDTDEGKGWVEIEEGGAVIIQKTKTGWKEAEVARGSSEQSCPVHALEQWLHFAKIDHGPIFRRVLRDNSGVQVNRLSDKHVARLIKKTMLEAGIRPDLPDADRPKLFSGHSLRAGLASYAEVDERHVQKQLGHASPQMTRRYQRRRDRFRVNLTKAAGL
ncbi:tyrosine-type recombinase/integrase [Labrenzia sp. DG1229]|uniref:tyrosine-type recombinase/integrase n=1 Tax=Labrenzia sp. DG1229 TaxID=681847 RepID=UPI000A0799CC|nr:tyrosine-type recombinase/integrase [Labrenzia sp. DG1229]